MYDVYGAFSLFLREDVCRCCHSDAYCKTKDKQRYECFCELQRFRPVFIALSSKEKFAG